MPAVTVLVSVVSGAGLGLLVGARAALQGAGLAAGDSLAHELASHG